MKQLLLLVVVGLLVAAAFCGPPIPPPDHPLIIGGKVYTLITFDVNKPPAFLDNSSFWDNLDERVGKDKWRNVESTATFNDDQPEFKVLMADQKRTAPNWLTIGTAKKIIDSEPLPADQAATEKIIGKYAK